MKHPHPTPSRLTPLLTLVLTGLLLCLSALPTRAATYGWLGTADNNWSTVGNWSGGVPLVSGDEVRFYDDDATGTPGPAGTPNSIVDLTQDVLTMQFRNTNGFHTVQIPSGITLSLIGATSVNPLFAATGTDAGGDQTVYASVLGTGTLAVTNPSGTIYVRQGSTTAGAHRGTLDLSGLDTFNCVASRISIGGEGNSAGLRDRPSGCLILARTNYIALSGSSNIVAGACASNGGTNWLILGQDNVILSDNGMTIGGQKCTGLLSFNPALLNSRAVFRNLSGDGPQASWFIGDDLLQGGGSGSTGMGTSADLTGGTVDAQVTTLIVGRGQNKANSAGSIAAGGRWGMLAFDAGEIAASTMEVGMRGATSGGNASGRVWVGNTARLIVTNNLRLGYTPSGATTCSSTLSLTNGGFVWVMGRIIDGGLSTNVINVTGPGTHLKVGGNIGREYSANDCPLDEINLTNATLTLTLSSAISTANPVCSVTNLNIAAALTLNVEGAGFGYGQYPLIKYYSGSIGGDGYPVITVASLPSGAEGYLSNNTASSSIDLVVTKVPATKWNGNVNGDWDIDLTANWIDTLTSAATTYQQSDVAVFDDTATGTTTVNLTTVLSPAVVSVDNPGKTYTFGGSGNLSGPCALVKSGNGTLVLNNSGANDFSGGVFINGGKLQLGLADDRLPISGNVALADAAGATLDLGGVNQTIGALTGGGANGGEVSLGTATLTTTAAGIYHGTISGSGVLRKTGTGTLTLGGANTHSGGTYLDGGAVTLVNTTGNALGSGPVEIISGTLNVGNGGPVSIAANQVITNNGSLVFNALNDITIAEIHGTGTVTKNNSNNCQRVTITGPGTYIGATTIYDGILRITDGAALGDPYIATTIRNNWIARLELAGNITVNEYFKLAMKQSAAGLSPAFVNVSGTNTLMGVITGEGGGSFWTFQSDAGKLIVNGLFQNSVTSSGNSCLRLLGMAEGEWDTDFPVGGTTYPARLQKEGSGTWTLSKDNYYNGDTRVYEGTLLVNGSIQSSPYVYVGYTNTPEVVATLGGSGSINGQVIVQTNGVLSPGAPASIGMLSIFNNLTTYGTCRFDLNTDTLACDQVVVAAVTYGGTLEISMSGGGTALTAGASFQLFNAGSRSGAFDAVSPLKPGPGLSWDMSQLPVDGTLKVVAAVTPPSPTIAPVTLAGPNLVVSVPTVNGAFYVLQSTTNLTPPVLWLNASTNAGTGGDLILNVPVQPGEAKQFFRFQVY